MKNLDTTKKEQGSVSIPTDAKIQPVKLGGLILCGYKIPDDCRKLSERKIISAETYWTVENNLTENYQIQFSAIPERECRMPVFSLNTSQAGNNSVLFTSKWIAGAAYKIIFNLEMPPLEKIANADLTLELFVILNEKVCGIYRDPQKIKMNFSHTPNYNLNFPDSIYQNEIGKHWTAKQLADVTGGKWIVPPPENWYVNSVVYLRRLARALPKPNLYIATTYEELAFHDIYHKQQGSVKANHDSHKTLHRFADQFAGAIVDRHVQNVPKDFPQLLVNDPVKAMFELAFASRKRFQGKVIAVTGSNGKSTTVSMIKNILSGNNIIVSTIGNRNVATEAAYTFASFQQNRAYAVMEIASMALDSEWGSITYGLSPNVSVVTSITQAHLLEHGTMEGVARAKAKIFCGMAPGGYAVLNHDMPYYEFFEQKAKKHLLNVISFGVHPNSSIRMKNIQDGEIFTFRGKSYRMNCPIPPNQIYDALAAIGVSVAIAVPIPVALGKLQNYKMVDGRDNLKSAVYKNKNLKIIDGSFNATFLSMKTGLEYLNSLEKNPKARVAILGDIAHLGDAAEEIQRQLSEIILANDIDRVILCGKRMNSLWREIKDKCKCFLFDSVQELIPELDKFLLDGDYVFIKASTPAKFNLLIKEIVNE